MRRTGAFLAGVSVGAALVTNWRSIAKGTVKAGIRGGTTLRASAARAAENLADVVQEATWEMGAAQEAAPTAAGAGTAGTTPPAPAAGEAAPAPSRAAEDEPTTTGDGAATGAAVPHESASLT